MPLLAKPVERVGATQVVLPPVVVGRPTDNLLYWLAWFLVWVLLITYHDVCEGRELSSAFIMGCLWAPTPAMGSAWLFSPLLRNSLRRVLVSQRGLVEPGIPLLDIIDLLLMELFDRLVASVVWVLGLRDDRA